jgi:hypothetical protein
MTLTSAATLEPVVAGALAAGGAYAGSDASITGATVVTGGGAPSPGVIIPAQPGGPSVGNVHSIACKCSGKWAGTLNNRQAKGALGPPGPLS